MNFSDMIEAADEAEEGVRDSLPTVARFLKIATRNPKIHYQSAIREALSSLKRDLADWDMKKERWKK